MEWLQTVYDEHCTLTLQPGYRDKMHVHCYIQDGCDYVCVGCGLLSTPPCEGVKRDFCGFQSMFPRF